MACFKFPRAMSALFQWLLYLDRFFKRPCLWITLVCFYALLAIPAFAQDFQPGFRTLGNWSAEPEMRLDLNVWYPTNRVARDLTFSPWTIEGAFNAKPADGKFPMIVISHATAGMRFSYHELAARLARRGFVVAAPTHGRDSMFNMDDLFTWPQLERRVEEIKETIAVLLNEKDLAAVLDPSRTGVLGFGAGGAAALLLGGAMPSCEFWPDYCRQAGENDVYCSPWAKDRINGVCQQFPLGASMADPRVKAIAAIAPGFGMIFGNDSFTNFQSPLLLVAAGRDKFNVSAFHCEHLARLLGKKAKYLNLANGDIGALMSPCPHGYEAELPELCLSISPEGRRQLLSALSGALTSFFSRYLEPPANIPHQTPAPPPETPATSNPPAYIQQSIPANKK